MSTIKPTIGRKVWLWVSTNIMGADAVRDSKQAFDASIAFVNGDGTITVTFADHSGRPGTYSDVEIHDPKESDQHTGGGHAYCTWMPYQKGQAAKAEATQADSHASKVLYPAIEAAMRELSTLKPGCNLVADSAFNHLHRAFWSESPAPASAAPLRPLPDTTEA